MTTEGEYHVVGGGDLESCVTRGSHLETSHQQTTMEMIKYVRSLATNEVS